jgi:hypothetical protein
MKLIFVRNVREEYLPGTLAGLPLKQSDQENIWTYKG